VSGRTGDRDDSAPQNLAAEEHVLGALLTAGALGLDTATATLEQVRAEGVSREDFYLERNAHVFKACESAIDAGRPSDWMVVREELQRARTLGDAGGQVRLVELAKLAPVTANAGHFAQLVVDAARRRRLDRFGLELRHVSRNGGPDEHPELAERLSELLERPSQSSVPFAVPVGAFIANKSDAASSLVGDDGRPLLPRGGLLILAGQSGAGKTTLSIEAALHLASGRDWLGHRVPAPLRVLLIENEGPREPFRQKLERRLDAWAAPLTGEIFVSDALWAAVTLADGAVRKRLRDFIRDEGVDVVMADPLGSLGVEGVGAPDQTREFISKLRDVGLGDVAFWLLHHFRKEPSSDELNELSGAWAQHTDAVLVLKHRPQNRARLSYPKLRWAGARPPAILAFDAEAESFSYLCDEGDEQRDLVSELGELLADGVWRTESELAAPKEKGGIGANRAEVKKELEAHPDLFKYVDGDVVGRSPTARCWGLVQAPEQPEQAVQETLIPVQAEAGLPGPGDPEGVGAGASESQHPGTESERP
jgi:hypothetical protein